MTIDTDRAPSTARLPVVARTRLRRAPVAAVRHRADSHGRCTPALAAAWMYRRHMGTAVAVVPTVVSVVSSESPPSLLPQPIEISDSAASSSRVRWRTARSLPLPRAVHAVVRLAAGRARLRLTAGGGTAVTLAGAGAGQSAAGEPPATMARGHGNACSTRDGGRGGTTTASHRAVVGLTTNSRNRAVPVRVLTLRA